MELLLRLANIADPTNKPVFGAIHIAAMLESAFLLYKFDKRSARLVLGESPNTYRGLAEAIKRCRPVFLPFSGLSKWLDKIDLTRRAILANDEQKVIQLLELSCVVGY
jgi:hypothetical protein